MTKNRLIRLACLTAVFAGGMVAEHTAGIFIPASKAEGIIPMTSEPQRYSDRDGHVRLILGVVDGEPQERILGADGKPRLVVGTAGEGDENGLASVALYDNQGRLKAQLRIVPGKNEPAQLVMKDSQGRDRIVMGMNAEDATEDPYFYYVDAAGQKHPVF